MNTPTNFNSLFEVGEYFKNELNSLSFIEKWRWKNGVTCLYCQGNHVYKFKDCKRFKCAKCKSQFTVIVGTIFENSKVPLQKWMMAIYLIGNNKKGISSYQLAKYIQVTQKTAWTMSHKIRMMLAPQEDKLTGIIQIDETFVGGKNKNRHKNKKVIYPKNGDPRSYEDKVPVIGMLKLEGDIICKVVHDVKQISLMKEIKDHIDLDNSILVTDEWMGYRNLKEITAHQVIDHTAGRHTNDSGFTTNHLEGMWSHLKRTIIGTHHHLPRKHLQKYVNEIAFRYNTRKSTENDRFVGMFANLNRPLSYKTLIHEEKRKEE